MHQTQFIKALASDLDDALELVHEHVASLGGTANSWQWELALVDDEVHLRQPDRSPDDQAWLDEEDDALSRRYSSRDVWVRDPWLNVFSNTSLAGVPFVKIDDEIDAGERATRDKLEQLDIDELAGFFLETALNELRARYEKVELPPRHNGIADMRRADLARSFELVYTAFALPYGDGASHLPYLREQNPYEWPAHLVGEGDHAIYILVDMHL